MDVALIPAGGHGTRFFGHSHPLGKAFITVGGRFLIEYVLDQLALAGVGRAVVAANRGNWVHLASVACRADMHVEVAVDTELRGIPILCELLRDVLPEQYFLVHSHQPVHHTHLCRMRDATPNGELCATLYDDYERVKRVAVRCGLDGRLSFGDRASGSPSFVGPPYVVVGRVVADAARAMGFLTWSGECVRAAADAGVAVYGVQASFPPEMDYAQQLPAVERFVLGRLGTVRGTDVSRGGLPALSIVEALRCPLRSMPSAVDRFTDAVPSPQIPRGRSLHGRPVQPREGVRLEYRTDGQ